MIKVGIVGIGFMGWIHYLAYQSQANVEVVAICSHDPNKRAGDWSGVKGNFGPPAGRVDLAGVKTYETIDEMLTDPNVDLVDLCTPPSAHLQGIIAAASVGKHVFCEKPLGLTLADCDRAVEVCQQQQVQLFVGHVLPFFSEYQFALQVAQDKRFGGLLGGSFKRVVSDPTWLPDFYDAEIVGGPLLDLHVHDAHFIRLLFGMPSGVHSVGRKHGQVVSYCQSVFEFADADYCVAAASGVIDQQGRPFNHSYEIHFEQATLQFEFAAFADQAESMPLKVLLPDGSVERPELGDGDPVFAFEREIGEVASCLEAGRPSTILDARLARDAVEICGLQAQQV